MSFNLSALAVRERAVTLFFILLLAVAGGYAFFMLGRLVEYADTKTIFMNPKEKMTEDYVTGRFG